MYNTPHGSQNENSWAPGYRILRPLQQSPRVQIFAAVHNTSEIHSALKFITNPEQAEKEIRTLRDLSGSPGIVPLNDMGRTTHGHTFLVFPLYPERSFGQVLANSGPVPLTQAVAVGRNIGAALAGLHSRGLLHNAVAPENILSGNTSLLTGFSSVTPDGARRVPLRSSECFLHAPPEAVRGEQLGPASDVYRLASTLWTLLMGRTPFSSDEGTPLSDQAYTERILTMNAPPVARRDISRVMSRVLTRAMAKEAQDRYQSAREFALALERARTGTAGTGGSVSLASPSPTAINTHLPKASEAPEEYNSAPNPLSFSPHSGEEAHHASFTPNPPVEQSPNDSGSHHPTSFAQHEKSSGKIWDESPQEGAGIHAEKGLVGPAPDRWSRLEGWTGDAYTRLPGSSEGEEPSSAEDAIWDDLDHEPRWRKQLNIAVVTVGVMFFATGTGVVMTFQPDQATPVLVADEEFNQESVEEAEEAAEEPPLEVAAPSPPPEVNPPSEVRLEDSFSSVTLTWTDNSGGTTSYFVLGERQGHDPLTMARTGPGAITAQVSTEEELAEYCFTVIAVDGASAPAEKVCTTRAADLAALEESEAEEEEEEEEEEDVDPSPSPSPDADD